MDMIYEDYVVENNINNNKIKRKTFWVESYINKYEKIIEETVNEIQFIKNSVS